jgi:hypothetical protein
MYREPKSKDEQPPEPEPERECGLRIDVKDGERILSCRTCGYQGGVLTSRAQLRRCYRFG